MIGKPIVGKSFGGCVRYLINRPEAVILDVEGLRSGSANQITTDFNLQRKLNPNLGKAVGHTILSWSATDMEKLNDELMVKIAKEYMIKMGIKDTQFLIVKHTDRQHPHVHLVYNRVNNRGETISDQNDFRRNVKACRELTNTYGFHLGQGKDQVNRHRLKGQEKVKYQIHDAIKAALKTATNWKEMEDRLSLYGIKMHFAFRSKTGEAQGISFSKEGIKMKGSAIDRAFSFAKLDNILGDEMKPTLTTVTEPNHLQNAALAKEASIQANSPNISREDHQHENGIEKILDIVFSSEYYYEPIDPFELALKRRKKKKKGCVQLR